MRKSIIVVAALAAFPACVSQDVHRRVLAANEQLQEEREALAAHVRELSQRNEELAREAQRLGLNAADAAALKEGKQKLADLMARFQSGGGGSLDIPGVSMRDTAEGVVVQVQGEVLFSSGKAELTDAGRRTLEQIAPLVLGERGKVRVDGHTDTDPIVHSVWKTNLRLSCERAMSVAQYLVGAGMPAADVSVAGYGEHRPIAAGDDAAAKQANRRVEILLLRK